MGRRTWLKHGIRPGSDLPELVHVVVDNASTDDTPAILERFQGGRVPVLVTRNPETIPVGAQLVCSSRAGTCRGQVFFVLCADDVLAVPHAIERWSRFAESDRMWSWWAPCPVATAWVLASSLPRIKRCSTEVHREPVLNKISDDLPHMYGLYRRRPAGLRKGLLRLQHARLRQRRLPRAVARGKFGYVHEPLMMIRIHPEQLTEKLAEVSFTVFEPCC
jgi:glycosyltransferase involved in cell wall biosynthesis